MRPGGERALAVAGIEGFRLGGHTGGRKSQRLDLRRDGLLMIAFCRMAGSIGRGGDYMPKPGEIALQRLGPAERLEAPHD